MDNLTCMLGQHAIPLDRQLLDGSEQNSSKRTSVLQENEWKRTTR